VYDAEQLVRRIFDRADEHGVRTIELLGSRLTLPIERKFASVESVQSYVDKVLSLNWIAPQAPMTVRARAGRRAAHYERDSATLAIPLHAGGTAWALRELVVLHEVAHHMEPSDDVAAHGPEFCGRYLELVDGIIGSEAAFLLRTTMIDCGVRVN
jgi:putative metallohydrolase (TIGR04338 family)